MALSVIGAGLIHLAAVPSHLGSPMAVASFTGIGLVQVLLGASLLQAGALRLKRLAVIAVGSMAVGAWFVSRTWGLPAISGHTGPEPLGGPDLAAVGLQLVALASILLPRRPPVAVPRRPLTGTLLAVPVVAVSAMASLSLLSVPSHGHPPSAPVEARTAAYTPARPLLKRAVPVPASVPAIKEPAKTEADDHASAPAHSH